MIKKILLWLLEITEEKVTYKTGQRVLRSGIYRSEDEYVCLSIGERVPPLGDSNWVLVVSV